MSETVKNMKKKMPQIDSICLYFCDKEGDPKLSSISMRRSRNYSLHYAPDERIWKKIRCSSRIDRLELWAENIMLHQSSIGQYIGDLTVHRLTISRLQRFDKDSR